MGRPRSLERTRNAKVDEQFYLKLKDLSQRTGRSMVDLTRELRNQDFGLSMERLVPIFGFKKKKGDEEY